MSYELFLIGHGEALVYPALILDKAEGFYNGEIGDLEVFVIEAVIICIQLLQHLVLDKLRGDLFGNGMVQHLRYGAHGDVLQGLGKDA